MKLFRREHLRQPRGHSGPSGIGGSRPSVLLNWSQGPYPHNQGFASSSEAWTNIASPTLSVVGRRQGLGLTDTANAGGVQYGADLEFGRPTSGVPLWLAVVYTHVPYFNAGSSVNTFANYGSGVSGLDGGLIFHVNASNQLRGWLMSADVTTTWSAVEGQTYHLLLARNANRAAGMWIDGKLIGTGTSSTVQLPGNSRVNLLSDAGLNERRARGIIHAYGYGEGDITADAGRISSNLWSLFGKKRRIWVPVAAGGPNVYDVTLTEAATATDLQDTALVLPASSAEAAIATDAIAAAGVWAASAAEAVGAAEVIAAARVHAVAQAEAASAAESTSTGSVTSNTLTETVSAADSLAALAALGAAISDTVTVTDLVVSTLAAVAAVAEAASLAEQQSTGPVVTATMAEAVSSADALQAAASLVAQVAETASAGDVMQAAQQLVALLTEGATAADSVAAASPGNYSVSIDELATALDQIVAALAGDSTFAAAVFRTARGTSTTRAVKGAARNSIRGYQ